MKGWTQDTGETVTVGFMVGNAAVYHDKQNGITLGQLGFYCITNFCSAILLHLKGSNLEFSNKRS